MSEITTKRIEAAIEQLKDLAKDRESFFNDFGDDEVFRQDYQALCEAVAILEAVEDGRLVVLPCKIGAKIFEANQHMGKVFQRLASKEDMLTKIVSGWGKRYFATPEEAEAALQRDRLVS